MQSRAGREGDRTDRERATEPDAATLQIDETALVDSICAIGRIYLLIGRHVTRMGALCSDETNDAAHVTGMPGGFDVGGLAATGMSHDLELQKRTHAMGSAHTTWLNSATRRGRLTLA